MQGKDFGSRARDHGHMKNSIRLLTSLALLCGAAPAFADADAGLNLAQHWCASCHVVSPDQKSASADVPNFADIARRTKDMKTLVVFLTRPHGQMPDMSLSQPEIADIVAYISTLGPHPIPPAERKSEPAGGLSGAIVPSR